MIEPALTGFATGFSLILAIGAQNAFVLRQGLLGQHVFWLALLCAGSDALLIAAGVSGFNVLVEALPALPRIMSLGGAAFLFVYGALRFRAAWAGGHALELDGAARGLWRTLGLGAALTWLNPHVYLDTLALIGAVSTGFGAGTPRLLFGLGATTASFVFFFGLGYGARLFAPVMQNPRAWVVLDLIIGALMWTIAAQLIRGAF